MIHIAFPTLNNLAWVDFWTIMFPLFVSLPLQLKSVHKKSNIIPLHLNKIFTLSSVKIRLTLIVARKFFGVIFVKLVIRHYQSRKWLYLITIYIGESDIISTNPFESVYNSLNFQRYTGKLNADLHD